MLNGKPRFMAGTVTPPDDLQPAIDALGEKGREYLTLLERPITPSDIAKAADYERGDLNGKP